MGSDVLTIRGTSENVSQEFLQWMYFSNDVRIKNGIVDYEQGVSDVR